MSGNHHPTDCACGNHGASPAQGQTTSRRRFLQAGLATMGLAGFPLFGRPGPAVAQAATPYRIDVHHHLTPPTMLDALKASKLGTPPSYNWSPQKSIEDMDKAGVATSITSITTPAVSFLDTEKARQLARECNDYAAKLMQQFPGRFGMFAAIPLTDTEGSLKEIEYALDTLKADGIALLTSYGDKWLGHEQFAPVLAELNRRKAVVYTHPTAANCCRNLMVPDITDQIIEYGTDTTRTIASLVFSGMAAKTRDIRWIFSHAGGTMPYLIERFTAVPILNKSLAPRVPDGVLAELKRFYYDTAQSSNPATMAGLMKLVSVSQVVFGTDYPFRTSEDHVKGLRGCGFSEADLKAIERDNPMALLPRLKA